MVMAKTDPLSVDICIDCTWIPGPTSFWDLHVYCHMFPGVTATFFASCKSMFHLFLNSESFSLVHVEHSKLSEGKPFRGAVLRLL